MNARKGREGDRSEHQIISCSQDRDLRIWGREDGLFLKKYDLSSFLAENVQCIKLGKNEDNLFLGSKDMNVYLINIQKGKLCVVYEGHWNKVTEIYSVPKNRHPHHGVREQCESMGSGIRRMHQKHERAQQCDRVHPAAPGRRAAGHDHRRAV